ncbi:MAG: radical SAM protein [Spirochaetales bacterium]|nr:radical SAM protein [Spirochaetales bacterium]
MGVRETEAKSILRKNSRIDSWFISHYGMNLYRGCAHNCSYCDGRAERYYVEGEFGSDIEVKTNAAALLEKELDPARKRKHLKRSFLLLGGGVSDSYQPLESGYGLTRKALELALRFKYPVSILTKSTLVERDLDVIGKINDENGAMVSVSFSSYNREIGSVFEPGIPSPEKRLDTLKRFKDAGIPCGIYLMPVIPFVTDSEACMDEIIGNAKSAGLDFVIFGGMTLKEGRQKNHFMEVLRRYDPKLSARYNAIYRGNPYGSATGEYYAKINGIFHKTAQKYKMPVRIPLSLFRHILDREDTVIVLLEHIDYLLKLRGRPSSFGYAAYNISRLSTPVTVDASVLKSVKGVNDFVEKVVYEILDTGTSRVYTNLMP